MQIEAKFVALWHQICDEQDADPREFGYLREDWKELHQNFRSPPSS